MRSIVEMVLWDVSQFTHLVGVHTHRGMLGIVEEARDALLSLGAGTEQRSKSPESNRSVINTVIAIPDPGGRISAHT
jgi:hypothetical protein